jgi:hypothetical protein
MRNAWWSKTVRLTLALVVLFAGAERAFGLARCPHHDAAPATGTSSHAGHASAAETAAPQTDHDGPCTCVGNCDQARQVASFATPPVHQVAVPAWRRVATPVAARSLLPSLKPHTLPFATAPPTLG